MDTPDMSKKGPYTKEMDIGAYAWCSCGRSENQPLCDGAHRGTDKAPVVARIDEKKTVTWCGCKQTKTPPYCDGSHNQ